MRAFSATVRLRPVASCVLRDLHASGRALKMERKSHDTKLRVHLFDFDAVKERVAPALRYDALPDAQLAPVSPSGWRAPAPVAVEGLPFCVHRTATLELPVYTEFKNKKARPSTIVRRVTGHLDAFESELRRVVGDGTAIKRRVASLEVFGDHRSVVSEWLVRCGF